MGARPSDRVDGVFDELLGLGRLAHLDVQVAQRGEALRMVLHRLLRVAQPLAQLQALRVVLLRVLVPVKQAGGGEGPRRRGGRRVAATAVGTEEGVARKGGGRWRAANRFCFCRSVPSPLSVIAIVSSASS
jgi:hypothetical protein